MEKIQVFMLQWSSSKHLYPNYFTVEAVRSIQELTEYPYELIVVDNYSDTEAFSDLKAKLPADVKLVRNDRPSRCVNSGRNKVWSLVDSGYFVLLHTDVKVTKGWLSNMVTEMKMAEEKFGRPCVMSPTFLPYPLLDKQLYKRFKAHFAVNSLQQLEAVCRKYGIPFSNGIVHCKPPGFFTDDGHQLMMFAASKWFRDSVGEWDERYTGANYDDCDMGIVAILKGCKNLHSQTTYVHHLQGVSVGFGVLWDRTVNAKVFVKKWGKEMFDDMQTGQLWKILHLKNSDYRRKMRVMGHNCHDNHLV